MNIDTQRLRELTEKATPGPWFHGAKNGEHKYCVYDKVCWTDDEGRHGETPNMVVHVSPDDGKYHDAAHIAAANPAAMTALLDEIEALKHDIGEYVRISSEQATEIERLRRQLEWVEAYAQDTLNTNSKDMDDWRGDVHHIANSARAALSQGEQK